MIGVDPLRVDIRIVADCREIRLEVGMLRLEGSQAAIEELLTFPLLLAAAPFAALLERAHPANLEGDRTIRCDPCGTTVASQAFLGEIGRIDREVSVLQEDITAVEAFTSFVEGAEPKIRQALTASLGSDLGVDATAEALAYGWEHWARIREMENPVGYLFVVGRNSARKVLRRRPVFYEPPSIAAPLVEPGLLDAVRALPERQRVTVMLLHCFEWTMPEVAELLGVKKTTVQNHAERAMARLRKTLGVEQ